MTYAAKVNRAQRAMLLTVCRGYRTVATDTLPVLAATLPADLAARRKKDLYWDKRNEGHRVTVIKEEYVTKWQERWDASEKGRALYE